MNGKCLRQRRPRRIVPKANSKDIFTHFTIEFEVNPHRAEDSRRRASRDLSSLKEGMPKVSSHRFLDGDRTPSPPRHCGSDICTGQPCRTRTDNRHPLVHLVTWLKSGRQPFANA